MIHKNEKLNLELQSQIMNDEQGEVTLKFKVTNTQTGATQLFNFDFNSHNHLLNLLGYNQEQAE